MTKGKWKPTATEVRLQVTRSLIVYLDAGGNSDWPGDWQPLWWQSGCQGALTQPSMTCPVAEPAYKENGFSLSFQERTSDHPIPLPQHTHTHIHTHARTHRHTHARIFFLLHGGRQWAFILNNRLLMSILKECWPYFRKPCYRVQWILIACLPFCASASEARHGVWSARRQREGDNERGVWSKMCNNQWPQCFTF